MCCVIAPAGGAPAAVEVEALAVSNVSLQQQIGVIAEQPVAAPGSEWEAKVPVCVCDCVCPCMCVTCVRALFIAVW